MAVTNLAESPKASKDRRSWKAPAVAIRSAFLNHRDGPKADCPLPNGNLAGGNPLIMKEMVKHVPDAGSYGPVTVLLDQRPDGVHVSYDKMESYLLSYGSLEALAVAHTLDAKITTLLRECAS
nr:hypothetical protein [Mesorhizobium sanjuanii]